MTGTNSTAATRTATPETLLRIIQSVPSPRAAPIRLWLAKVGYERIQVEGAENAEAARKARRELEEKTGRSVVTGENFLPPPETGRRIEKG